MPNPVSTVSHNDTTWTELPTDRDDFRETIVRSTDSDTIYSVCRTPPTVLGAAIWGDATTVSNACRCTKPNTLDAQICDDSLLQKAQQLALDIAKKAANLVLGAAMGRSK
jgi:hypothetical protein